MSQLVQYYPKDVFVCSNYLIADRLGCTLSTDNLGFNVILNISLFSPSDQNSIKV